MCWLECSRSIDVMYQHGLLFLRAGDSYLNVDQEFTLDMTFGAAKEGDAMSDDE